MQNLRYKILFVACALFTGVQTILGVNASEHYTFYTREFLRNLGVRNPATVPVRRIDASDRLYHTAAGYSDGTAIHLNEDIFANHEESTNLFTCAHEAAHHALRHAYQVHRDGLAIEQEADVTAARMLCTHGYRWIVEEKVDHLRQLVRHGQGAHTDGLHPTVAEEYDYLRRILEANGGDGNNVGRERNPGRDQNAARGGNARNGAGRDRNPGPARNNNPGRGRNNNTGRAGRGRNGAGSAANGNQGPARNTGRDQNAADRARRDGQNGTGVANPGRGRNNNPVVPERNNTGREQNADHGRNNPDRPMPEQGAFKSIGAEFRDLWNQFNDLSRAQKLVLAGILAMAIMRR